MVGVDSGGMTYKPQKHKLCYPARVRAAKAAQAAVEAREESAARYEAAESCSRLTKKGQPCRGLASKETGLCPGHQLQAEKWERVMK